MRTFIEAEYKKAINALRTMATDAALTDLLVKAVAMSTAALRAGGKIMFAGNGGSAADAQHWAGELVSRFYYDRPGLAGVALTTDSSIITAVGNDYGYDYTFARQVEALGRPGDVLVAITTSGNSPNVLRAAQAARQRGIRVIGFTGEGGGKLLALCDVCLRVPSNETPRIQEGHEFLGHLMCALIEAEMHPAHGM
ncbi:MAG: D-sedoheptulose-7-phosphate isomerase [Pseudomonadota bacterium]